MKMNYKDILLGFFLTALFVNYVSAGDYVDQLDFYLANGIVNGTGSVYNYHTTYLWGVNVSGSNVTAVNINGTAAALNGNSSTSGNGTWYIAAAPPSIHEFDENCTYVTVTATATNYNASGTAFTNSTTQNNITVPPCIESETITAAMTVTDENTSTVTVADSTAAVINVWMDAITFNASHNKAPYSCSNAICTIDAYYVTTEYGSINVTRSSTDTGTVLVDFDSEVDVETPSQIPKAAIALTILTILGGTAYITRVKRQGSSREA